MRIVRNIRVASNKRWISIKKQEIFLVAEQFFNFRNSVLDIYVVGSKSFRPDIQKPRQMENAVRDIYCHLW